MSDISVTVTNPGLAAVTIGAGGSVSATVSSGGSVEVNLPGTGGATTWSAITGKPETFPPAAHAHKAADITDRATALVTSVNGQTGAVTISGGGGGPSLSDATPQAIGTASPGTSSSASRADHVHALPALVASLNTLTGPLTLAAGTGVTITPSGSTLTIASTASAPLADATPQPLGIAAVGTSTDAAREDHVHAMPSAADVGALDENSIVDGGNYIGYIPQNTITIVTQPTAQTASNGAASFSVAATSTPGGTLSYQWEKQDGGFGDYNAVSGATSATLALSGLLNTVDDGDRYRVVVSATNAVSVISQSVLLTVPANVITITTQPSNQTASGGAATFTAAASVAPSGAPSYQWQRSDDAGVSWANVAGATSATLALTGLTVEADGDSQFRVIVLATNAANVTSNAATLTVQSDNTITITSQPTNQTASGGAASFSVAATSSPAGTPTYQWQRSDLVPADGSTWTQRSLPASAYWYGVTYGNGQFVAVAWNSNIAATSPDGVTWTQRTLPASAGWYGVAYGNGQFVAVARNSNIAATSPDGITWTLRSLPASAYWLSVTYGNGQFVAVASGSIAATSPDGVTWTQRSLPASASWYGVTYGNGQFVAVARNSNIAATSPDGITWTLRSLPASAYWYGVAYGNGQFVAVAEGSNVAATSPDGITWTQRSLPASASWYGVTYGNGQFVAVAWGSNIAATSPDGVTWTQRTLPANTGWTSVTYGNGLFVAVASYGNVAATSDGGYGSFANIPNATSSTLALTGLTASNDQDQYRAVVSATNAAPVTSNAATLTVVDGITITQQPADLTTNSPTAIFNVTASVTPSQSLTYQWQESVNGGSSWSNIGGATSSTLSVVAHSANGYQFRVIISAASVPSVTSNAATLTVP